jgi:methionine sulfoxide reductase heme-binding subunit
MTDLGQLTWTVARAGGFLAYILLTASVVVGLVLSLGWRSRVWTRFVTTETHRFFTLVGLVFVGIHGAALLLDPFIGFGPLEIVLPGLSHYRPLWVALGIVGGYLAVAIWASEYARPRIGYRWWRRFHVLAFVAWMLATVHGIGTGTDTRTPWALAIYGTSLALVVGLLVVRLWPRIATLRAAGASGPAVVRGRALARTALAGVAVVGALGLTAWTLSGPAQPGWNAIANDGHGSGGVATAALATGPATTTSLPAPAPLAAQAFRSRIAAGYVASDDGSRLLVDGVVESGAGGRFQLVVPALIDGPATGTLRIRAASGGTCVGSVVDMQPGQVVATCTDATGAAWTIGLRLERVASGSLDGIIVAQPGGDPTS